MSDNETKKEIEVVTEVKVEEKKDGDRNVGQDVQVVDEDTNTDETKGNVNEELVNEDSDDEYWVYETEEERLLEEKKEAKKKEDKRLKEEERDTFWGLFDLMMERDRNLDMTNNERMEHERVFVMGDMYRKMEYMEEENDRCSKWINCRLIRAVLLKKQGYESKCLCCDENERERFNASPEYREFIEGMTGMTIEEIGTFNIE